MRRLTLILLILISCSWFSSLAEGPLCEEDTHQASSLINPGEANPHDAPHPGHVGSCHFGHCSHLDFKSPLDQLKTPAHSWDGLSTPYAFTLPAGALRSRLRPPVFG